MLLPLTLWMLLFGLSAVLGVAPAYDPALAQGTLWAIVASVGLFLAFAYLARTAFIVRVLSSLLVTAGTLFALLYIGQYGHQGDPEAPALIQQWGVATTFLPNLGLMRFHPNGVATLLEALLPLAAAAALGGRRLIFRAAGLLCLAVLGYAVLLTASRGAWVGLAAAGLLALLLRLPRAAALALTGLVLALLAAGAWWALTGGLQQVPALASTLATAESRLELYRNSLRLAGDYAFTGIGLGDTFGMVYSRFSLLIFVPYLTYSHNLPLTVWLGQGLLGLAALAGIVIAFYGLVYRALRLGAPEAGFHGAWLGVTVSLMHGLTDARQYTESPWAMPVLFMVFGLAAAWARLALRGAPVRLGRLLLRGLAAAAGVGLVAATAVFLWQRPLLARWHTNQGAVAETHAELAPNLTDAERDGRRRFALEAYRQALAVDPDAAYASRRLGNLLVATGDYAAAIAPLEATAAAEPDYQAAVKGLGLAYVWVGRIEDAARTLARLDDVPAMVGELYTWSTYRGEIGQTQLSQYARQAAEALAQAGG